MTASTPEWIHNLKHLFESAYIGDRNVLVTAIDIDGNLVDAEPIIADFGDILPFLWHYGMHDFVEAQLRHAAPFLKEGLYVRNGRLRLFSNHDWLLGLLDLYRQSGQPNLLHMAETGARTVETRFFRGDYLIDEIPGATHWRSWLLPASPFNGGYIELWLDLYRYTGGNHYLDNARRLATAWLHSPDFIGHGVFSRQLSTRSDLLNRIAASRATLKARLFKDNTNLVWSLLALYRDTGEQLWQQAISRWLRGFEQLFCNDGKVYLMLDAELHGYNAALKAGFSSLDLLCDIAIAGINMEPAISLARQIADYWLTEQWPNGLFPEIPGGTCDHLDANVDMIVALAKLYDLTGDSKYLGALNKCRHATLALHAGPMGYCQAVGQDGAILDSRIIIKYQGLLMKLNILPTDPRGLIADSEAMELLRDR